MRWVLRSLFAVLLLISLLVGAAMWLASTENGLRFAVRLVQTALDDQVVLEGPQGSLDGVLRFARIVYTGDGTTVEALGVEMTTHLGAAWKRRVLIERADIARVVVHQSGATAAPARSPPALPASLALPLELRIDGAIVRRIEIVGADATTELRNLYVSYTGGRAGHTLRSFRVETDWGTAGAAGTISATAPYDLDVGAAALRAGAPAAGNGAPASAADLPVEVRARIGGSLRETEATVLGVVAGARVNARTTVTAFDRPWPALMRSLQIDSRNVDLARVLAGLPHTDLALQVDARGSRDDLRGELSLRNAAAGPIDRARIPVSAIALRFVTDLAALRLERLAVDIAPHGTLRGEGSVQREPLAARLDIQADDIDLRALRSDLHFTALGGPLRIGIDGPQRQTLEATLSQADIRLSAQATRDGTHVDVRDVRLETRGGKATGQGTITLGAPLRFDASLGFSRFDPARFGDFPAGVINGNARARGELGATRRIDATWRITPSRLRGQALTSQGSARVAGDRVERVDATARLGSNSVRVEGAMGGANDRLQWRLDMPALAEIAEGLGGQLTASGTLSGTLARMRAEVDAQASQLQLPSNVRVARASLRGRAGMQPDAPLEIALRADRVALPQIVLDGVALDTTGTRTRHEATLRTRSAQRSLALQVRGGWKGTWPGEWAGELASLQASAEKPVKVQVALAAPAPLAVAPDRVAVSAMRLAVTGDAPEARIELADLAWQPGRLVSNGSFEHLSTRWLAAVTTLPAGLETTVSFGGQWSILAQPRLDGTLAIVREQGDVRLAGPPAIEAGLAEAAVRVRFDRGNVAAEVAVDSKLATLRAHARVAAVEGAPGIAITPESAVGFDAKVDVAELRVITEPLQTFARVSGRLAAQLQGAGTLGAPRADGTVNGDALAVDVPPYGIALDDGRVRIALHGEQVQVNELTLRGGEGRFTAEGTLALRAGAPADLRWRAENFRLLNRPDMRLVVSGNGNAGVANGRFGLRGDLRAERGHFEMAYRQLAKPGEDVEVLGQTPPPERHAPRAPLDLDLRADLGKSLTVRAAGFDGKATGNLHLTTTSEGELRAAGRVQAADAKFRAYGQQLVVDPGVLVFDGPIDNPTLQITAWRRNQQVEAGVQLSGTAKTPQVTLVSQPEVPQGDRLSWLVLGHGPGTATGADLALLQGAAGAFLGGSSDSVPLTQKVANSLGLDELAVRSSSEIATSVVAVGKRLSDKLLVTYEHGLGTAAENLVRLDYSLTRRVSLRAETGTSTGLGVFYRFAWD